MSKKQPKRKHVPQRTCVVCRNKFDKREITRIVRTDEGALVDPSGKLNGRGAYLCNDLECWDAAVGQNRLNGALKMTLTNENKEAILALRPVVVA